MATKKESSTAPCLKLLSWNIDGLDERNTVERTQAVCEIIKSRQPDCVCLQEVIDFTRGIILKELGNAYDCYSSLNPPDDYYPAILMRKGSFSKIGKLNVVNFRSSEMGRHLLQLPVCFKGIEIDLLTSHLESKQRDRYSAERQKQLHTAFGIMVKLQESNKASILAGDLNIRDNELESVKIPERVVDTWEACGSDERHQYTWDTTENDNLEWRGTKPSLTTQYDRMYLSPSDGRVKPKVFELVGKERIPSCGRFPSDHWGMWAEFEIV